MIKRGLFLFVFLCILLFTSLGSAGFFDWFNDLFGFSDKSESVFLSPVEIDKCSYLSNRVKENIINLQNSNKTIVLREGSDVFYYSGYTGGYFVISACGEGLVLRVVEIDNPSSFGFLNDRVELQIIERAYVGGALERGDSYSVNIIDEGRGLAWFCGEEFFVNYSGSNYEGEYVVRLSWGEGSDWGQVGEEVDVFEGCETSWNCVDSDVTSAYPDGKNYFVRGVVEMERSGSSETDYCSDDGTGVSEHYCNSSNNDWPGFVYYDCPDEQVCSEGACVTPCDENSWVCGEWTECRNGRQTRSCGRVNCETDDGEPEGDRPCEEVDSVDNEISQVDEVTNNEIVDEENRNLEERLINEELDTDDRIEPGRGVSKDGDNLLFLWVITGAIIFILVIVLVIVLIKKKDSRSVHHTDFQEGFGI